METTIGAGRTLSTAPQLVPRLGRQSPKASNHASMACRATPCYAVAFSGPLPFRPYSQPPPPANSLHVEGYGKGQVARALGISKTLYLQFLSKNRANTPFSSIIDGRLITMTILTTEEWETAPTRPPMAE